MHPTERTTPSPDTAEGGAVDRPGAPSVVCAIPARFGSTRLPAKALRLLRGRPMIQHVVERACRARSVDRVVVLTDDERILEAVQAFGGECEMTPTECPSGTDRIAWAARGWEATGVVNVQGDEPMLDPEHVDRLAELLREDPEVEMATLAAPAEPSDLHDPSKVKVVRAADGRALYFSRAPIPHARDGGFGAALRHVGIYAYRRDVLLRLAELEPTPLERIEALEQLRALENGISIRVLEVAHSGFGIDTEADLERAERSLDDRGPKSAARAEIEPPVPVQSE